MDFQLTADQDALVSAVDKLATRFEAKPTEFRGFALFGQDLERELEDGQYFEIAQIPELGPLTAAMAVQRLARLPCTAEIAVSMLVRPQLPGEWPRPIAVVENSRPARFVASAKTILVIQDDTVGIVRPAQSEVKAVESLFAYPMGKWQQGTRPEPLSAGDAANIRKWLRIALASEVGGLLQAAVGSALEHLSSRKSGRPLGTLQALRHRMAESAVLAGGVRWLALKAAGTGEEADAALAALHAQE